MNQVELETWLTKGYSTAKAALVLNDGWWPMTKGKRQAEATAWAFAFFLHAALDRCSGPSLTAACSAGDAKEGNEEVLARLWTNTPGRLHQPGQVLVDFSIHNWGAANPIQLTGESEMNAQHGVGDSLEGDDDYSWDFYKLLLIPSTTRLFVARVGGRDGHSAGYRCEQLAATLESLIDFYAPALLRPHDELGAVIISSAKRDRARSQVLWLDRGRLRRAPISIELL
jgi:hypothetical protein